MLTVSRYRVVLLLIVGIAAAIVAAFVTTTITPDRSVAQADPAAADAGQPVLARTLEEAERKMGHDIAAPSWLPGGYELSVVRLEQSGHNKLGRSVQVYTDSANPSSFIWLIYDPTLTGILDGKPATIGNKIGSQQNQHPPIADRPFGMLELYWADGNGGGWMIVASDVKPVDMETLTRIAQSM